MVLELLYTVANVQVGPQQIHKKPLPLVKMMEAADARRWAFAIPVKGWNDCIPLKAQSCHKIVWPHHFCPSQLSCCDAIPTINNTMEEQFILSQGSAH